MFTRCPNCRQQQSLTVDQLRLSGAIVSCRQCSIKFDALELLSETATEDTGNIPQTVVLPWEQQPRNPYWLLGTVIGIVLLLAQIVYFEGNAAIAQNVRLRPRLESICQHLGCRLPDYKNPDELILKGALMPSNDHYAFMVAINNQAAFAQAYPNIKLTLLGYNGSPFTHRIFYPQEYAAEIMQTSPLINAGATLTVQLDIAATKNHMGGYTFDTLN
ncbi:MAG: zinc-ribbon and DUF3426 domain-containing protein [Methylovulum sp.]|nr:zinc-ribbon and DUF3426 domain-containing protein [Methylovulum sp.]